MQPIDNNFPFTLPASAMPSSVAANVPVVGVQSFAVATPSNISSFAEALSRVTALQTMLKTYAARQGIPPLPIASLSPENATILGLLPSHVSLFLMNTFLAQQPPAPALLPPVAAVLAAPPSAPSLALAAAVQGAAQDVIIAGQVAANKQIDGAEELDGAEEQLDNDRHVPESMEMNLSGVSIYHDGPHVTFAPSVVSMAAGHPISNDAAKIDYRVPTRRAEYIVTFRETIKRLYSIAPNSFEKQEKSLGKEDGYLQIKATGERTKLSSHALNKLISNFQKYFFDVNLEKGIKDEINKEIFYLKLERKQLYIYHLEEMYQEGGFTETFKVLNVVEGCFEAFRKQKPNANDRDILRQGQYLQKIHEMGKRLYLIPPPKVIFDIPSSLGRVMGYTQELFINFKDFFTEEADKLEIVQKVNFCKQILYGYVELRNRLLAMRFPAGHGDIKLENLLYDQENNRVLLGDIEPILVCVHPNNTVQVSAFDCTRPCSHQDDFNRVIGISKSLDELNNHLLSLDLFQLGMTMYDILIFGEPAYLDLHSRRCVRRTDDLATAPLEKLSKYFKEQELQAYYPLVPVIIDLLSHDRESRPTLDYLLNLFRPF